MLYNIKEDFGSVYAQQYINKFKQDERIRMIEMIDTIRQFGKEAVLKQIQRIEPEGYEDVETA
jgi:hypothetical protein